MYVSSNGKAELVEVLLELGADPTLKNFDDWTALDLAACVARVFAGLAQAAARSIGLATMDVLMLCGHIRSGSMPGTLE